MNCSLRSRGAALPETVVVLSATLALIFGILQIGVIGFLQVMVDGAAFVAAHEYALDSAQGNTAGYAALAQRLFPQAGAYTATQNSPDATTVAVNYGTANPTQRHGGASLVRATHGEVTVGQNAPAGLLGAGVAGLSNVAVHGSAIEPEELVSNTVYDANGEGYSGATAQGSYFPTTAQPGGDPQNAPANYISQHIMSVCTAASFQATCPSGSLTYRTLGTAVFLDHDNWQRSNLGVGAYSSNWTFGEMLCHQQVFAAAAVLFAPQATLLPINPNTTILLQIASWDYRGPGGYGATESAYGAYPLYPAGNNPASPSSYACP